MIVNEEVIYPSMVIRSQAEAIELLEQENKKYKEVIDRAIEYLEKKRIREKAIVDIDVLEGILKEVSEWIHIVKKKYMKVIQMK